MMNSEDKRKIEELHEWLYKDGDTVTLSVADTILESNRKLKR